MKFKKSVINICKAFNEVKKAEPLIAWIYLLTKNVRTFLNLLNISIAGRLIDSVAEYILSETNFELSRFIYSEVFTNFILILLIFLIDRIIAKFNHWNFFRLTDSYTKFFKEKSIDKVSTLNLEDIEKPGFKDLLTNVPTYSSDVVLTTYMSLVDFISYAFQFISVVIILLRADLWWALIVVFFTIPEAVFRFQYNSRLKKLRDENVNTYKYFNYLYQQSCNETFILNNFSELRVDGVFGFFKKSFNKAAGQYYGKQDNLRKVREGVSAFWSWFDGMLCYIVQILLVPYTLIKGLTIGRFKALYDYVRSLYESSWATFWRILSLRVNAYYLDDYFEFFEYEGFGDVASGDSKIEADIPQIEFVNVDFSYEDSDKVVLEDISFRVDPGEKLMIVGKDNSGKSTIAKLLCGLYRVEPGDILIDEVSIKNLDRGELKSKISVVFEDYIKYQFSLRKNIVVTQPKKAFDRDIYEEALQITGLDEWMEKENIDENQNLGKLLPRGMEISSGHWQRIAIARAIYRNRPVLILDESFTQIDGFSRQPILERLVKHRPNWTIINISQDKSNSELFDRIIYIKDGEIVDSI